MKPSSQIGVAFVIGIVILTLFGVGGAASLMKLWNDGIFVSEREGLNIIEGSNINIACADSPEDSRVDCTFSSPATAPDYIEALTQDSGGGFPYVLPGWYYDAESGGATASAFTIHYIPIFVTKTTSYDRVAMTVLVGGTSAATPTARMCLYDWNNGTPGALIEDYGTVGIATGGQKLIVIDNTLERGYYFLAYFLNDSSAEFLRPSNQINPPTNGFGSSTSALQRIVLTNSAAGSPLTEDCADPALAPNFMQPVSRVFMKFREG